MKSMKESPAISSEVRTHLVQEVQRSRSSSTSLEIGTGLSKVRLASMNLVSPPPRDMTWFCSGHAAHLSHIAQPGGRRMSGSSKTPLDRLSATADVSRVV